MTTLIGTNPDQIPVNSMLGGMAYQDPDSINVKDLNSSGSSTINTIMCTGLLSGLGQIYLHNGEIQKSNGTGLGLGGQPNLGGPETLQIYGPSSSGLILVTASSFGSLSLDNSALNLTAGIGKELYLYANNTPHIRVTTTGDILNLGTGATKLQVGTTAQRPASPQEGMIRKNSTLGVIEGYSGGDYVSLEAGRLISRTVFTSDGTFTPNSKTKEMIVELVGGGGGSGGVPTTGASQASLSTAGGFGEYLKAHWPRSVPVAASYNVLIGTGGAGGSAGTNSGLAGGQTRFSDGVGSIAGAKGGYGGAGGVVETVFPVIRKAALAPSDSYVSGSFQEWDKLSPPRPTTIIYNSSGSVMVADLIQPFVHRNDVGVGGDFKVSFASTAQAGGNPGQSGVVVIYEYS